VLHAQPELSITVMVRNPAPYALEQWRSDPTIVQVTVSNPTSSSKRFVLDLYLQNQNTRQEVQTNEMHPCMPVFELAPGQTRTLNGPELICEPSLVYDATIRTQLTTTGAIPEGEYRFCVRALDADSRSRELTSSGALCASTQVQWYDPPAIVRPVARDGGLRCDQAIVLNWQPPIPVPAPGSVVYRVRVVGMFEGQLPRQALEAATRSETVVDAEVSTTSYTIGANDPVMLDLLRRAAPRCIGFAWQVQALQATTRRPFPTRGGTQGNSTIETFTVECPGSTASEGASCSGAMSLRCYYPLDGDTIPWIPPHLIVQWSPYCDDVIGFTFELNVIGRGVTGTNRRTLNWPRGPIEGQSLRGFPRASERAQLHIVNWQTEAGTTPAFNNDFRLGETYRWSVNGTLVRRESGRDVSYPVSTPVATVNLGLRMPRNPSPADGATIASGRGLTLQWEIPEPRQLGYVPEDLLTLTRGVSGMQFGAAAQFVRVVLARDSTFRTPVASWSRSFPATGNYVTNDAAARELFGTKNWSGLNLENGTYYWRVEYASATDTSSVYRRGPVWRFTIGSSVGREECIALRPATPEHRSTITTTTVQFAVFAEPQIRVEALQSCQVRIWSMSSASEDPRTVRSRAPVLDVTITDRSLLRATASGAGTNLALLFINGSGPGSRTFTPTNGTTYLWECVLQFEGSRIRSDGISCDISTKSCEGIFTFRQGECNDPCTATAPTNRTPLEGILSRGDRIRIGHFEAELEDVSGSPSSLSGRALVHLPWLNLRVRVSFSGLRVNTDRQVYEGTMEAVQASGSPLDATLANQPGGTGEWLSQDLLRRVHEYASDAARLVSSLRGQPVELPVGFDRVIEGQQITVGIVGMVFRPTGAYLNAAIVFPLPWLGPGQHLGIGAREICFSPNGLGRTVELYLARDLGYRASDASWAINLKAPQEARGGMPPDSGTYVRFGCAGFEFLRVALEVEFPRSWMVPVPDDGSSPVRLRFTTTVRSTGDFIAAARMNRFSPAGAPGFEMQCDNVVLDFSDRDNPEGIEFPSGYRGETSSRWQGFYLGTLSVQLPEQLRTFSGGPPQISLRHMIIDRSGVNFQALATSVISYPQGNFGGWGASIDTIGLAVVNSSLQRGWMGGRFKLPVSDSALRYSAILRDTSGSIRFEFTLQPSGTLNLPLWVASLDIERTSWVRLEAGSGTSFVARARLDGTINFGGTREIPLRMGGIRIQGFQIQTHATPYVQVGSISFASPPHALFAPPEPPDGPSGGGGRSAGGFPITIGGFEVVSGDRSGRRLASGALASALGYRSTSMKIPSAVGRRSPSGVHCKPPRAVHRRLSSAGLT
jgi:hypothetical protein